MTVLRLSECDSQLLPRLLASTGLCAGWVAAGEPIPGSHWGDEEAGLIKDRLWIRADTPLHSALHEAGHWMLMSPERRQSLHTDAQGSQNEENAVCLLQILLAERCAELGAPTDARRMCEDMDRWGYNFMIGSARDWFEKDADDTRQWLQNWHRQSWAEQTATALFPDGDFLRRLSA